ncbi:amidohydrolase family protein [Nonomuraea angiospora]
MSYEITRRTALIGGLSTGLAATAGTTALAEHRPGLALTRVTVIDPARDQPIPDTTVLIRGDQIISVGEPVPHDAEIIDLAGKYLIPGLWDMHMSPPLNIVNGVTTVQEMQGTPLLHEWRAKTEKGKLIGPRSIIGNRMIDGYPSVLVGPGESGGAFAVKTPAEARKAVRHAKTEGADFVKVYSRLSVECFLAIADEARRLRIPLLGHAPDVVPVVRASDAGMRSIEHVHSLLCATSARDQDVRRGLANIKHEPEDYAAWFDQYHGVEWLAGSTYSPARAAEVFARLAANGTAAVPTLIMHRVHDLPDDVVTDGELNKYVPKQTLDFWQWVMANMYKKGRTQEIIAQRRELFEYRLRSVKAMHEAGIRVMAGTDTGMAYTLPGFGLHDELALLVRAGLTPMQALRSATLEPARFMGRQHKLGSIRPGKLADLVILDANPLDDIRNTAKIDAVLSRGRLITSGERDRMLADVARAAQTTGGAKAAASASCCGHGAGLPHLARTAELADMTAPGPGSMA